MSLGPAGAGGLHGSVDGDFGVYPGEPEAPDDGLVWLWFFVSTWNSRMMFTAQGRELGCELGWGGKV